MMPFPQNALSLFSGTKSANFNAKGVGYWEAMGNTCVRRICGLKALALLMALPVNGHKNELDSRTIVSCERASTVN